jgi:hypothetical protein
MDKALVCGPKYRMFESRHGQDAQTIRWAIYIYIYTYIYIYIYNYIFICIYLYSAAHQADNFVRSTHLLYIHNKLFNSYSSRSFVVCDTGALASSRGMLWRLRRLVIGGSGVLAVVICGHASIATAAVTELPFE